MSFLCSTCGKEHKGLPLDIAFAKPAAYLGVPKESRAARCRSTNDLCVIDGIRYFIRGTVPVPVRELGESFVWGMWAEITRRVFKRYRELYEADGSSEPPHSGRLCGDKDMAGYEGVDGHPVAIQFGPSDQRPVFTLKPSEHLLYREQQAGITIHRVHEILSAIFPNNFGSLN